MKQSIIFIFIFIYWSVYSSETTKKVEPTNKFWSDLWFDTEKSIEYRSNNIIEYTNYNASGKEYRLNSEYLDISSFNYKLDSGNIESDPKGLFLKFKSPYYELERIDFSFDISEFEWTLFNIGNNNQYFSFQENDFSYINHTFKIPYKDYQLKYNIGRSVKEDYKFNGTLSRFSIDINSDDSYISNQGLEFEYKDYKIGYINYYANGDMTTNYTQENEEDEIDVLDAGNLSGSIKTIYLGRGSYTLSYSKLLIDTTIFINWDNLWAVILATDDHEEIELSLNGEIDIYNLQYSFEKNINNFEIKFNSNIGLIKNTEFYYLKRKDYYENVLLSDIEKTEYDKRSLEPGNIYYALFDFNIERRFGNLSLGLNKLIPIAYNFEFTATDYTVYANDESEVSESASQAKSVSLDDSTDDDSDSNKELLETALLSGLTLYFKYDF